MPVQTIVATFFDPRGRCDRRGLLVIASVLLTLQVAAFGLSFAGFLPRGSLAGTALDLIVVWSAFVGTSKRLHDVGLPVWWVGAAFAAVVTSTIVLTILLMCFLPDAAFEVGGTGYIVVLAGNMLPVFGLCLWMHCVRGERRDNHFGPEPDASGFSHPISKPTSTQALNI